MKRVIACVVIMLLALAQMALASVPNRIDGDPVVIVTGNLISAVDTLPVWAADYEGTICYDRDTDKLYYGGPSAWVELGTTGTLTTYQIIDDDGDTKAYVDDSVPSDNDQFVVVLAGQRRRVDKRRLRGRKFRVHLFAISQ